MEGVSYTKKKTKKTTTKEESKRREIETDMKSRLEPKK